MAAEGITAREIIAGVDSAIVVEDYPDYYKGPCMLVLQRDQAAQALHVVCGNPKGQLSPAVLVTAYRPDPDRWSDDFVRRRT